MILLVSERSRQPIAYVTPGQYVSLSCDALRGVVPRLVMRAAVTPATWSEDEESAS